MNFIKKCLNKIKEPKGIWLVLFYMVFALSLSGTITLVVLVQEQTFWHYILYVVSAIDLSYFVYTIIYFTPIIRAKVIDLMLKNKFMRTILQNYGYRTLIFSIFSFVLNLGYVIFMGVLAIITSSAWYISMTAYYLILTLMKGNIYYSKLKYNTERKRARAYRFCGIMFILLTIAFSGVILLMYKTNMYFEYAGLMIYVVALFTFYKLVLAIINIFKAKKQDDLYVQSIRNINLSSALISIIVLQVAMFQAFSPESNQSIANALTGAGVSLMILGLGIFMIIKANKTLKEIKEKENEQ